MRPSPATRGPAAGSIPRVGRAGKTAVVFSADLRYILLRAFGGRRPDMTKYEPAPNGPDVMRPPASMACMCREPHCG